MKRTLISAVAAGTLLATSHAATADDSYHSRYTIVQFPITQNGKSDKVLFLDQHTGTLWSWSEAEGVTYLPGILRPGNPSAFARIIRVDRQ
jgi:hypothetical protein